MKTKIEQLYDLYCSNPHVTNSEAAELLDMSPESVRVTKYKLAKKGVIQIESPQEVKILAPYREGDPIGGTTLLKMEIYTEMVQTYMNDFREQTTFQDRLTVGREIRRVLDHM
jgi:hypothetical protein